MSHYRILPLLLAFGTVVCADNAQATTVQGRVFSANGSAVSGATVTASQRAAASPTKETPGGPGNDTAR